MMNLEGRTLHDALSILRAAGIEPEIVRTAGFREAADGTERIIRVQENGRRLTVARFPDRVKLDEHGREAQGEGQ